MPFQCCHMGLLGLHAQLVQLLQGQRDQAKDMTRALQKQPQDTEEITEVLEENQAKQDQQAWEFQNLQNQMGQEINGEFWGANDQCDQVIAQLICQQGVFSKGHLPVLADKNKGQFFAAQGVLQQHGGTQSPVTATDQQYITQLHEMLPRHAIGLIFPGRFQRP